MADDNIRRLVGELIRLIHEQGEMLEPKRLRTLTTQEVLECKERYQRIKALTEQLRLDVP
jgi:hypothetical protein